MRSLHSDKTIRLYIDARALASERISGIGHNLVETVHSLEHKIIQGEKIKITLLVPISKARFVNQWGFQRVNIKRILIPMRIINVLERHRLLPPMDIFLGRGIYIFPNYTNWPILFSKSLTHIHDISYVYFPLFVEPRNLKMLLSGVPRWIHRSDKVIAISHNAGDEITKHFKLPPNKVQVVTCGVDTKVFLPQSEDEIKRLKNNYNLPPEYILYFGNIEPRKNLINLVNAYKTLPKSLKDRYALVLAGGDGWLNESIHQTITEALEEGNNIIIPGKYIPDADLPALYSGAIALAHPSYYEGFGISPLQAMACGVPVMTSNVSSMPEVVGNAGLYVNPRDQHDIGDKMKLLLENASLRNELVQKGFARSQQFNWDESGEKLLTIIKDIYKANQ